MMLVVALSYMAFIKLRYRPSLFTFWRIFIINECWILSKVFSAFLSWLYGFYSYFIPFIYLFIYLLIYLFILFLFILSWSYGLLMWCITLIDLWVLKNPCIPGVNPTWWWCMILLRSCWIQFASICWRFLHLCFSVILACNCVCVWEREISFSSFSIMMIVTL